MKTLLLLEVHKRLGARIGEFVGWQMPIDYGSAIREAVAVRTAAGIFDVSHMGRIDVTRDGSLQALQSLLTNDVSSLADNSGQYTLMCNETGGVKDDLIVYRREENSFLLVVNASNLDKDKEWMSAHFTSDASMTDCTAQTAMFALQGPNAVGIMHSLGLSEAEELRRFHFLDATYAGRRVLVARTGYTGEDGFEIICDAGDAETVWNALNAGGEPFGLTPCGLAARDILRIEAGLPLHGHEMDETISPVEAGLMRFVKMDKREFIGRESIASLLTESPKQILMGIEMNGRTVPRAGDRVRTTNGGGHVTSGTYSPTLGKGIGMAYVPVQTQAGEPVELITRGRTERGAIVRLPFYSRQIQAGKRSTGV
jgi:aminomethyltransferase